MRSVKTSIIYFKGEQKLASSISVQDNATGDRKPCLTKGCVVTNTRAHQHRDDGCSHKLLLFDQQRVHEQSNAPLAMKSERRMNNTVVLVDRCCWLWLPIRVSVHI